MDGYEASSLIRQLARPDAQSVPIVALTANAFKEDIDKALRFGMNGHTAKPVEMDALLEVKVKHEAHAYARELRAEINAERESLEKEPFVRPFGRMLKPAFSKR